MPENVRVFGGPTGRADADQAIAELAAMGWTPIQEKQHGGRLTVVFHGDDDAVWPSGVRPSASSAIEDAVVVLYAGDAETATAAYTSDALRVRASRRPVSVVGTAAGLLVTYEPTPAYDWIRLSIALVAAAVLVFAGIEMLGLRTIDGNTVAELFDRGVGIMSFGLAVLAVAVGLRKQ